MKSNVISKNVAQFRTTKNPIYLAQAIYLIVSQGRTCEAIYGIYCNMFCQPSVIKTLPHRKLQPILENFKPLLSTKDFLKREDLIEVFGDDYAVRQLPDDFCGARIEGIVCDKGFLLMGEYGYPGKRIVLVTQKLCIINKFYNEDPSIKHIHALYKSSDSRDVLITTGDSTKCLDLWCLEQNTISFNKRLRKSLAGHTAIVRVRGEYNLGTDFSGRPNYIESLDGRRFFYPEPANGKYVVRFQSYQNRYIASLNKSLSVLGGEYTLSIFDAEKKEFVYCDYQDYIEPETANKALHRTTISLRSIAAGEL